LSIKFSRIIFMEPTQHRNSSTSDKFMSTARRHKD